MSLIRPEVAAALYRWREVIAAGAAMGVGLWLIARGGWLLGGIGTVMVLAGFGLGRIAWRRLRFARPTRGPGVVELDEGQISWFGPGIGGAVAIADLAGLGLVTAAGLRCWKLRQTDGQELLIPVDALGAERLFDVFATLPGLDGGTLIAALDRPGDQPFLWHRRTAPALR